MEINFTKEYLKELYQDGKTSNKKYRYQKDIIKRYKNTIDKLKAAGKIEDLYPIKSLNYEKLIGDKNGLESVRVNDKYRVEFISSIEGKEPNIITICAIVELSKHYS
ncbi:MAG: type II toxin-antitoxin system RelE/ParE family toxin [Saprospiraceae bacterium]|jgi:proteic killer suppression protein|nr:type II toxin-antitoxin system RelE/ParE family toxin [Saprospiraceae bacterium]